MSCNQCIQVELSPRDRPWGAFNSVSKCWDAGNIQEFQMFEGSLLASQYI